MQLKMCRDGLFVVCLVIVCLWLQTTTADNQVNCTSDVTRNPDSSHYCLKDKCEDKLKDLPLTKQERAKRYHCCIALCCHTFDLPASKCSEDSQCNNVLLPSSIPAEEVGGEDELNAACESKCIEIEGESVCAELVEFKTEKVSHDLVLALGLTFGLLLALSLGINGYLWYTKYKQQGKPMFKKKMFSFKKGAEGTKELDTF